ncbi:MAG: M90 family metallopeptidase [Sulfurimonas sp.]
MAYYLILIQFFFALIALFLLWKSLQYFLQMWRYKKLTSAPFPGHYQTILDTLPHYRSLPSHLQEKIRIRILFFIGQKEFIGARMEVTEKMKVIIAFYASLTRLGFDTDEHNRVATIIVYPNEFLVDDSHTQAGIRHQRQAALEGQSANGTVVLSWEHVLKDMRQDGKENVILHEFAHELDFEDGMPDGTPELEASAYPRYTAAFSHAFTLLTKQTKRSLITKQAAFLGTYALENEAEFFAVCSERFFMAPKDLKTLLPNIYEALKSFYRLDTLTLFKDL